MKYLCKCAMNIFRLKILSFILGNPSLPRIKVFPIKVGLVSLRTFPWFSRNLRQIDQRVHELWSDRQTTSDIKTIVIPLFTGFDCICVLDSLCFVVKKYLITIKKQPFFSKYISTKNRKKRKTNVAQHFIVSKDLYTGILNCKLFFRRRTYQFRKILIQF